MPISAAAYHAGKFLQEHELLPESKFCAWCNFAGDRARVLQLQKQPDVWLLKCPRCYAISASRVATPAALDAYYGSYYADTKTHHVTCGNPAHHARHIFRHVRLPRGRSKIALLDFGGGDGSISYALAAEIATQNDVPVEVVVVDYNETLVVAAHPRVTTTHASTLQEIPERQTFDIVLAGAILEHLPEPADVTRRLLAMLSRDGWFYARTPYMVPLLRLLERAQVKLDFTFPAHFHDLGQEFWEHILSTLGLPPGEWTVALSRPSLVETSLGDHFARTMLSHAMKAPWWLLGRLYPLVGGWEVFIRREFAGPPEIT